MGPLRAASAGNFTQNPAGHEIHSCPTGYILFLIVYENPLGCFVAQGNVSFGCFQKDGTFVGFFFLDLDFHVNVDAPALEVVHEAVVFHDTADVGGISYFQISQPLAGDSQTAAIFSGMGSPWGQWVGWFR